jgi:hypothetical protein
MARPTCLYCGAAFPEGAAAAPPPPAAPEPLPGGRALVVIDLRGADVERLGHALGLSPFDARQRVSSGGYQLHRALLPADADAEAARLRALGLPAHVVPPEEAAARCRPLPVRGGDDREGLLLRTDEGAVRVRPGGVFLIVRGPITREYQTSAELRRVRTATLEGGHRIHLHRPDDPRPLEVDPLAFEFADTALPSLSSLLTILGWLEEAVPGTPIDDGFRRLTPALAPARAAIAGRLGAADALGASRRTSGQEGPLVLDNVEQFRAYSAWRAAVEPGRGPVEAGRGPVEPH